MYGIAIAACGMFSTLAVLISVGSYASISDNAVGLSKMSRISQINIPFEDIHSAGMTINAHVKSFEIGGGSVIALAIFGAFIARLGVNVVDLLRPIEFAGLIIGAMIPYVFSAKILQAITASSGVLKNEIRMYGSVPNYHKCIRKCIKTSIEGIAIPCTIAICTPLIGGILFGPVSICGMLAGTIVAGVQIATAAINSGTAWNSVTKYIEGRFRN